jgi:hypothetical protein
MASTLTNSVDFENKPVCPLIPDYCNYMKFHINQIKVANPGIDHKVAFKQAAANWQISPDRQVAANNRNNRLNRV